MEDVPVFTRQVGLAIRRWCAPVLDLPAHVPLETYLAHRAELGGTEVTRRLLHAADLSHLLVKLVAHNYLRQYSWSQLTSSNAKDEGRAAEFLDQLAPVALR